MAVVAPTPIDALPTPPSTSDPANFDSRADAFLGALPDLVTQTNALGDNVYDNATDAATSATTATTKANEAAASAASALNAPGTSATSTTSLTVGSGSKSLTLAQTGKDFALGQPVRIADNAAPSTNWMQGVITAFTPGSGAMTVDVGTFEGSGTISDWTISLTGPDALPAASGAEVRSGAATDKAVTPDALTDAVAFTTLTDASTVAWDAATDGPHAKVTLGGNRTIGAPTNLQDGKTYVLNINPATYTPAWASIWNFGDLGAPVLPASVWSKVTAQYDSARNKLDAGVWRGA